MTGRPSRPTGPVRLTGRLLTAALLVSAALLVPAAGLQAQSGRAEDARALVRMGQEAQLREDPTRAVELYRAALRLNPSYLEATVGLAETFFSMEEYEEALRYVEEARRLDARDLALHILEGRVCIALGRLDRASSLFGEVLRAEPNNLEARFGMAELDIFSGKLSSAAERYMESLRYSPENRDALLSLAGLYEAEGDAAKAGAYMELALRLHSGNAGVQLAAGLFAWRRGRYADAEHDLLTALSLKGRYPRAQQALAEVYLSQGRVPEAIDRLKGLLDGDRDNPVVRYLLGLAYDRNGDTESAVRSLAEAVRLRTDDELARIALEDVIRRRTKEGDALRQRYGAYHLERGRQLEERNYLDKALFEYRRSLQLDPLSGPGQYALARVYLTRGFPGMYLDKLTMMKGLGIERVEVPEGGRTRTVLVSDEIEILTSETADRLSTDWGVDQYAPERQTFALSVFTLPERNSVLHRYADELLTRYWVENLQRNESLSFREEPQAAGAFDEAFRRARENGSDYFLLLGVEETERSVTLQADLYQAGTGRQLAGEHVFRTGNDRVRDAVLTLSDRIEALFPLRGRLLGRRFGMGIVDQGRMSGLEQGQKLLILRQGSLELDPERVGFIYRPGDVLGDFEITRTDEKLAEGRVLKSSFFDRINPEDVVIRKPEPPATGPSGSGRQGTASGGGGAPAAPADGSPGLLRRIYRLIGI